MTKTITEQNGSLKKVKKNLAQGQQKLPAFMTVMDKRLQIKTRYPRELKSSMSNYMTVTHKQKDQKKIK